MAERLRYEPLLKVIEACEQALYATNTGEFDDAMRKLGAQVTLAAQDGNTEHLAACIALANALPKKLLDHDVLPQSRRDKVAKRAKARRTFAKAHQLPEKLRAELAKRAAQNPNPDDEGALL